MIFKLIPFKITWFCYLSHLNTVNYYQKTSLFLLFNPVFQWVSKW